MRAEFKVIGSTAYCINNEFTGLTFHSPEFDGNSRTGYIYLMRNGQRAAFRFSELEPLNKEAEQFFWEHFKEEIIMQKENNSSGI